MFIIQCWSVACFGGGENVNYGFENVAWFLKPLADIINVLVGQVNNLTNYVL